MCVNRLHPPPFCLHPRRRKGKSAPPPQRRLCVRQPRTPCLQQQPIPVILVAGRLFIEPEKLVHACVCNFPQAEGRSCSDSGALAARARARGSVQRARCRCRRRVGAAQGSNSAIGTSRVRLFLPGAMCARLPVVTRRQVPRHLNAPKLWRRAQQ